MSPVLLVVLCMSACANDDRPDLPPPAEQPQDTLHTDTVLVDTLPTAPDTLRFNYLALGDSYTIGTGLPDPAGRWPVQLVNKLNAEGIYLSEAPRIIAQNGWTTANLINGINNANLDTTYRLVSLLIGVNNQFQNRPIAEYSAQFSSLLQTAVNLAGGEKSHVFVVSIPDYGVTPFGQGYNPTAVAAAIDLFNDTSREITLAEGISYYDITGISRQVSTTPGMLAPDNLHPSALQYALWVDSFYEQIKEKLNE